MGNGATFFSSIPNPTLETLSPLSWRGKPGIGKGQGDMESSRVKSVEADFVIYMKDGKEIVLLT